MFIISYSSIYQRIRGLLLLNMNAFWNTWSLEHRVQSFVRYGAYEKFPVVHKSHRAALKHRPCIGILSAYPGLLRQNILAAKYLARKDG